MNMTQDKLNRLKEVLSVPTHSRNEKLMVEYLQKVLTEKGIEHYTDTHGNIYATKGKADWYPCFISHTDTVHKVNMNLTVIEEEKDGKFTLRGIDGISKQPSGIGGDDKCGVYLCLEMLDALENVKAAFFVSEEIGCQGSKYADPEFFKNVGYGIQYDSPEGNSMSLTLMGRYLFNQKGDFADKVTGLITEAGIDNWAYHPYTDAWQIVEKFNIACLNLAAGYYRMHSDHEYVVVDDVQNGFELGLKLISELGEAKYDNLKEERTYGWVNRSHTPPTKPNTNKGLLNEAKSFLFDEEEDEEDEDDEFYYLFNSGKYLNRDEGNSYYNRGGYDNNSNDYDFDW